VSPWRELDRTLLEETGGVVTPIALDSATPTRSASSPPT
jgi:hypothetical protein